MLNFTQDAGLCSKELLQYLKIKQVCASLIFLSSSPRSNMSFPCVCYYIPDRFTSPTWPSTDLIVAPYGNFCPRWILSMVPAPSNKTRADRNLVCGHGQCQCLHIGGPSYEWGVITEKPSWPYYGLSRQSTYKIPFPCLPFFFIFTPTRTGHNHKFIRNHTFLS